MSSSDPDQKIEEFVAITGGSKDLAKSLLAICNGNLEMAINMHMEGVDVGDATQETSDFSPPSSSSQKISAPQSNSNSAAGPSSSTNAALTNDDIGKLLLTFLMAIQY